MVLACASVVIPAVLDFQQKESLAKNATIAYYQQMFDSPAGRLLEEIAIESEIFYWAKWASVREEYEKLPMNERADFGSTKYREFDREWRAILLEQFGSELELRKFAALLLQQSDDLYECARFREFFKDGNSGSNTLRWGALNLDESGRLIRPEETYLGIVGNFLWGFYADRQTGPLCHQDSVIGLFGRRFSGQFWYLRSYLYCDEFLRQNYFGDQYSDDSPIYRLESIAMVIEQVDLEFRFSDNWPVIMRTREEVDEYKASHSDARVVYNFRLNLPEACG